MTPEQQELALALVLIPGRGRALNPDGFRARTGIAQPSECALHKLQDAILRHEDHALRATAQRVLNRRLANPPDPGRPRIIEPLG